MAGNTSDGQSQIDVNSVDTWIFDLDNTLYPAHCDLFSQISQKMGEFIAHYFDVDHSTAKKIQKDYFHKHGTTLRGLMVEHNMDPAGFLHHVHDIDLSVLPANPTLRHAMAALPGRKVVFTNGTVPHAERILQYLEIEAYFDGVFDIVASDYVPKPNPGPYEKLIAEYQVDPSRTVMVEDMAKNLKPAAAMGMTTVWVVNQREWAQPEHDQDHIHHITDDLGTWLHRHTR